VLYLVLYLALYLRGVLLAVIVNWAYYLYFWGILGVMLEMTDTVD